MAASVIMCSLRFSDSSLWPGWEWASARPDGHLAKPRIIRAWALFLRPHGLDVRKILTAPLLGWARRHNNPDEILTRGRLRVEF